MHYLKLNPDKRNYHVVVVETVAKNQFAYSTRLMKDFSLRNMKNKTEQSKFKGSSVSCNDPIYLEKPHHIVLSLQQINFLTLKRAVVACTCDSYCRDGQP